MSPIFCQSVRQYLFSVDDVQSPESDCVYQQDVYINLEKHKELCLSQGS